MVPQIPEKRGRQPQRFTIRVGPSIGRQRQNRLRSHEDEAIIALLGRLVWVNEGCTLGRETECVTEVTTQFYATRHLLEWECAEGAAALPRSS